MHIQTDHYTVHGHCVEQQQSSPRHVHIFTVTNTVHGHLAQWTPKL